MFDQIQVDHTVVSFSEPRFNFGGQVWINSPQFENKSGYIVGMLRHSYGWKYLVVEGAPPTNESREYWHYEHHLSETEPEEGND